MSERFRIATYNLENLDDEVPEETFAARIAALRPILAAVDADMSSRLDGLPPGDYVRLSVSDTGAGMSQAVRERAFEPFFTTKEEGRGTGLGLTIARGVVEEHGGTLTLAPREERGLTVSIELPLLDERREDP